MHIVHLIFCLRTGGIEYFLIDLAKSQSESNTVSVVVINNNVDQFIYNLLSKHAKVILFNRERGSRNPAFVFTLNLLLARIKPDIIHCHQPNLINLIAFHRSKSIFTIHSTSVVPNNLGKFRKIVAVSNSVKNAVSAKSKFLSLVIENGLDAEKISFKKDYGFTKDSELKIIQVSRLEHRIKGQDLLIQAGCLLSEMSIKFSIDFVGTGSSLEYLKEQVRKYDIENHVKFLGIKTRDWVHDNLSKYDILVQPSRSEGFGLTALEGVFAKLPVITSDVEGLSDLMDKINCPNKFEHENSNALMQIVLDVRNQYFNGSIVDLCAKYFQSANEFFSIENTTRQYNDLYENTSDKGISDHNRINKKRPSPNQGRPHISL